MCVDCTLLPSGNVTLRGSCASLLSTIGASVTRKFPVAPESSTAHSRMSFMSKSIVANKLLAACPYIVLDVRVGDDVGAIRGWHEVSGWGVGLIADG